MAAAGEIVARCLDAAAAKARAGRHDRRARRGGGEVHPLAGRRARLQGLPRLSGLDLRLARTRWSCTASRARYELERGDILSIDVGVELRRAGSPTRR